MVVVVVDHLGSFNCYGLLLLLRTAITCCCCRLRLFRGQQHRWWWWQCQFNGTEAGRGWRRVMWSQSARRRPQIAASPPTFRLFTIVFPRSVCGFWGKRFWPSFYRIAFWLPISLISNPAADLSRKEYSGGSGSSGGHSLLQTFQEFDSSNKRNTWLCFFPTDWLPVFACLADSCCCCCCSCWRIRRCRCRHCLMRQL